MLVWRFLSGDFLWNFLCGDAVPEICPEIFVRRSLSEDVCLEIVVRRFVSGDLCPEILVRISLFGDSIVICIFCLEILCGSFCAEMLFRRSVQRCFTGDLCLEIFV